ncbi:MAG: metalloregulator ArsR/SmtB family transcription factor [Bacteroidota bacterium]
MNTVNAIGLRNEPPKLKKVARLLKTVGHPARLMIIDLLLDHHKLPVKEIFQAVDISQSNASQHLKALEEIGILVSERDGKHIMYSIDNPLIRQLIRCVQDCTTC